MLQILRIFDLRYQNQARGQTSTCYDKGLPNSLSSLSQSVSQSSVLAFEKCKKNIYKSKLRKLGIKLFKQFLHRCIFKKQKFIQHK